MKSTATYCALLSLCLLLSLSACNETEPDTSISTLSSGLDAEKTVMVTDSTEWIVRIFKEHVLYADVAALILPSPYCLPSKDEAAVLRSFTFGGGKERFVTNDGYTFGMPSASVTKAGAKTKYSVLGLYKRRTVIVIKF